jgi:hypothetical protein
VSTPAGSYRVAVGSQQADLPLVPLGDDRAIALMMTIDLGVRFTATAGAELARLVEPAPGGGWQPTPTGDVTGR